MALKDTPIGSDIAFHVNKLANIIHNGNKERGFWEVPASIQALSVANVDGCAAEVSAVISEFSSRNVGELIALVHSELSEALEAHRKDANDDKHPTRKGLHIELGDALVRILDMCAGLNIDIGNILLEIIDYNSTRPYKHGKKY